MSTLKQLVVYGESFSPWTKKARWALEQCGLSYDYKEYIPTLSEPGLRWRLRQLSGSVSVPVMFADDQVLRGSWEIAGFANKSSDDLRLGDFQIISSWNQLSEDALAEGRTAVIRRILASPQALEESLPTFVPKLLHRPMRVVARDAVKRLDRKYAHLVNDGSLLQALSKTREALTQAGNDYLLGKFSYADIAMAVVLEVIAPIAKTEPALGPSTKFCWRDSTLADEFSDLVEWRDRLAGNDATSFSQFSVTEL